MNQKQRKEWEELVASSLSTINKYDNAADHLAIVAANAYILKLERELQNIKGHKRIAKVLMPKENIE
jgi:hypothetical protein